MTNRPERSNTAGRAYLDLRKLANDTQRSTGELLQLYVLEGFLDRLTHSRHRKNFVLKGGVLLAAYDVRRPTRDIDFAAADIAVDTESLRSIINEVLNEQCNDGIEFDLGATSITPIRDDDPYPGARAKIKAKLSTALFLFHVDINFGDPLWPEPQQVGVPRLLGGTAISVTGYRIELVLAEKIVTAIQRGTANTRWRDFVDIAALSQRHIETDALIESISRVAAYRKADIMPLSEVLDGYANIAQASWQGWRHRQQLTNTPEEFSELLAVVLTFSDPHLADAMTQDDDT